MSCKMKPKTLKALKGSILKWKKIAQGDRFGFDLGALNCPLCKLFLDEGCVGCPVMEATGRDSCDGSPYRTHWGKLGYPKRAIERDEIIAATRELVFLESLLPK